MQLVYTYLFIIAALQVVSADNDAAILQHLKGIVGGSVHMHCEVKPGDELNGLYFQEMNPDGFINGFYFNKEITIGSKYINRTIFNKANNSMEMFNLSPADQGDYICIPFSKTRPSTEVKKTKFHVTVTANYSKPTLTVQGCGGGSAAHNCVIECSSAGGFPKSVITWDVLGDETWNLLRNESDPAFTEDRHTRLWNVSHAVTLNCTRVINITCSIGGVVSQPVSVCQPSPPDIIMPIACAVLLLVSFVVIAIVVVKCRRTQASAEPSTDAELATLNSGQAG